jgi:outer membrane protein TolC
MIWGGILLLFYGCASTELRQIPEPLHATGSFETALLHYVRGHEENALDELNTYGRQRPQDQRGKILYEVIRTDTKDPEQFALESRDYEQSLRSTGNEARVNTLNIHQVLSRVESHNPRIRRRLYDLIRARAALDREGVSYGPEFDLITRFYPGGVLASLTQSAIDGIWKRNYAIEEAKGELVSRLSFYARSVRLKSYLAIKTYVRILFEQKRRDLLRQRLRLARSSIRSLEQRVKYYISADRTLLDERKEVQKIKERYKKTKIALRHAKNRLNTLMNRPVDALLRLKKQVPVIKDHPPIPWAVKSALARRTELSRIKGIYRRERGNIKKKKLSPLEEKGVISYGTSSGSEDTNVGSRALGSDLTVDGRYSIPLLYWPIVKARNEEEWAILNSIEAQMDQQMSEIQQQVGDHMETLEKEQRMLEGRRQRLQMASQELDEAQLRQENGLLPNWGYYRDRKHHFLESQLGTVTMHRNALMTYLELTESMGVSAGELPLRDFSEALAVEVKKDVVRKRVNKGIIVRYGRLMAPDFQRSFLHRYLHTMGYNRLEVRIDEPIARGEYARLANVISGARDWNGDVTARVSVFDEDMRTTGKANRRLDSVLEFQRESPEPFDAVTVKQSTTKPIEVDQYLSMLKSLTRRLREDATTSELQFVAPRSFLASFRPKSRQRIRTEWTNLFDVLMYRYGGEKINGMTSNTASNGNESRHSSSFPFWLEVADQDVVDHNTAGGASDTQITPRAYRYELQSMSVPFQTNEAFNGILLNDYHRMKQTVLPE